MIYPAAILAVRGFIAFAIFVLLLHKSFAQNQLSGKKLEPEPLYPRIGVYGAFVLPFYDANFNVFPGFSMCVCDSTNLFRSAGGFGVAGGVLFQQPLSASTAVQLRLGYVLTGGSMTRLLDTLGVAFVSGQPVIMRSEYNIAMQMGMIAFEPRFVWMPLVEEMGLNLGLHLGLEAAWTLNRTFVGVERLLSPNNVGFPESGLRTRSLAASGASLVQQNPFYLAVMGAVSYDFPLGETAWITPELSYHFNLLTMLQSPAGANPAVRWTMNTLRLGASLTFDIVPPQPQKPSPSAESSASAPAQREIVRDKPVFLTLESRSLHVSGVVSDMRNVMANATVLVRNLENGALERFIPTRNAQFDEMLPLGVRYEIFAERAAERGGMERTNSIVVDARSQAGAVESLCNHLRFQAPTLAPEDMLGVILFDYDDERLREYEARLVRDIASSARQIMRERPSVRLMVVGHTSEEGTSEHNFRLSVSRAMMVRRGLEAEGIDGSRIFWEGLGELRPVAENFTENGRRLNRRAEVRVLR